MYFVYYFSPLWKIVYYMVCDTGNHGYIKIKIYQSKQIQKIIVAVLDSGIGMTKEETYGTAQNHQPLQSQSCGSC